MYDDARELDNDETVTEAVELDDSTTIIGVNPFAPIDAHHVDADGFEPIGLTDRDVSRF